jgi:hypothetical protein
MNDEPKRSYPAHGETARMSDGTPTLAGELLRIEKQRLPRDVELTYKLKAVFQSYALDCVRERGECPMCGAKGKR